MKSLILVIASLLLGKSIGEPFVKYKDNHGHNYKKASTGNDTLYIHLLPHTHDDVGWLKTVDMYYTGDNNLVQRAQVNTILDNTIPELLSDPNKKFTYVEMKFFSMWWKDQTEEMKSNVRTLVNEGRLEFVNAGWSMHDEASPYYEDMINNMYYGNEFLYRELGVRPKIGWQIDPFGHSNANPRLFAEMGFDAVFFARADFQDIEKRLNESSMEYLWRPFFKHLGKRSQILAHTMLNNYCAPDYFGFDTLDLDNMNGPFVDDPELQTFNADWLSKKFIDYVQHMSLHYRTNHLLVPMGCDFQFSNPRMNFISIDKMIAYINSRYGDQVQLMYSTPGQYLDALIAANISWPVRYDDMFPYADNPEDYWTGYFTSRPNSKKQIRDGSTLLHSSNLALSLKVIDQKQSEEEVARVVSSENAILDILGVYQHHDAITGTAKQYVADDYTYNMYKASLNQTSLYEQQMTNIINQTYGLTLQNLTHCPLTNGTYLNCSIATNEPNSTFIVAVHNPSMIVRNYLVLHVPHQYYSANVYNVTSESFQYVNSSIFCYNILLENGTSVQDCNMHIDSTIQAMDTSLLKVSYNQSALNQNDPALQRFAYLTENSRGSLFKLFLDEVNYKYLAFQLRYYKSDEGGDNYNNSDNVASGAYIFKAAKDQQDSLQFIQTSNPQVTQYATSFVQEIEIIYEDKELQRRGRVLIRAYKNQSYLEFDVTINPLPANQGGMEVTVNFFPYDFNNNQTFYTDSNGLEMQERKLNGRVFWNLTTHETASSNYYPVDSAIMIKDPFQNISIVVLNDRAQGGSVLQNGRVELMQHRRLFKDDSRGVAEPLSENGTFGHGITVQARYFLDVLNDTSDINPQRTKQQEIDTPLQYFLSFSWSIQEKKPHSNQNGSKVQNMIEKYSNELPDTLKVVTFPVERNILMIRIENIADLIDYPGYQLNQTTIYFDIPAFAKNLFLQANVPDAEYNDINIYETILTGTRSYTEMLKNKVQWRGEDDDNITEPVFPKDKPLFNVALPAQRIRQFYIQYVPLDSKKNKSPHDPYKFLEN